MNRKTTTTKPITIRNDFNVVNNPTTIIERKDSLHQQPQQQQQVEQCIPIINLDDSDDDDDIVCKTETPSPINCENNIILYYCECGDESQHSPVELYDSNDDDDDNCNIIDNNNFTCIRYDYDNKTKDNKINQQQFNGTTTTTTTTNYRHTTPLFTYMKESKQQQEQNDNNLKNKTTINNNHHHHHHYQLKRFDYYKSNGRRIDLNDDDDDINSKKVKINDYETTKSPETRKNELCTYLKLMKPSEQQQQKDVENLLKNRRSVRVKNLNLQNEQKQIDKNNDDDDVDDNYNDNNNNNNNNKYLPLPPIHIYQKETNFDDDILDIIDNNRNNNKIKQKDDYNIRKKKYLLRARVNRNKLNWRRINSLRSKGRLKNVSLDQLILRRNCLKRQQQRRRHYQQQKNNKMKRQQLKKHQQIEDNDGTVVDEESTTSSSSLSTNSERCEIITICTVDSDDDNDDVSNNNTDGTIENVTNLNIEERKELLNNLIGIPVERKNDDVVKEQIDLKILINFEHDYAEYDDDDDDSLDSSDSTVDLSSDSQNNVNNVNINVKEVFNNNNNNNDNIGIIKKCSNKNHQQQQQQQYEEQSNHSIKISKTNGIILCCKYINNHLIIVQQDLISFWTQSQLGSMLCSHKMWIKNGQIKRLSLNKLNDYIQKKSINCIISMDTNFSYIELWIKEHKSNIRTYPVCDIFATVYFWRYRQIGLDKKVLQLENIKGSSEHVQYVVLPNLPLIIVCWYIIDGNERKTQIRSYMLANDYQTVASVCEFTTINHYVSSLHNIEDCNNLVMGCGDNRILLWNTEHGYLIANIDLYDLKPAMSTLWVKWDRDFIFVVQQHQDKQLRLIAINGSKNSWKQLHTYGPPPSLSTHLGKLLDIYVENGILIAYYENGVLCWNTQTRKPVLEEDTPNDIVYIPSGKYVIIVINDERMLIKHALTHFLITAQDL